ncbi:SrfA family protein [Pantoea eucrina]|uniref:SrfA family protein n=1 Tax=Pantoea eucrina TaxID=472693 RepID=A0ABU5LGT6_9GAMM|nr:SrfA family protein [Pantoea eucrina]MDZ7279149.1 SrfA family protein [Pantoea eucrina]
MQNLVQGPLLRTGNNSSFKALGETGYPVFNMAFQLREAIKRQTHGEALARHLAVPQNERGGDQTDWYSSFAGDVIPWSSASESERASALQQFAEFQRAIHALSDQMLQAENSSAGGDKRVFAQLLTAVVHFPDETYLYLVDGIVVLTFWGFVHPSGEQRNPMHWLQASTASTHVSSATLTQPVTPLSAPLEPRPVAEPLAVPLRKKWRWNWRWLLGLLLGLLALALLLGLLRGCVPGLSLPSMPHFSLDRPADRPVSQGGHETSVGKTLSDRTDGAISAAADRSDAANRALQPSAAQSNRALSPSDLPSPSSTAAADIISAPSLPKDEAPAQSEPALNTAPPVLPDMPAQNAAAVPASGQPKAGEPLTLPPALPDGPAQFLNGQWAVKGGIQDTVTSQPLQLRYDFHQGKGTVSVSKPNGVTCTSAASGNVHQGALSITQPEQMTCSDGSSFIGPTIECKSPSSGYADCIGKNAGDKTFPIRMQQPNT